MSNTYKRPDSDYNTETSSKHANRFQEQAINKTALKGRVLDDEFNATVDSLNDLDERVAKLQVGLFPGSNNPANADNVIYCDGREAKFGKITQNLMANSSVGTDQLQDQSISNDKIQINSISNAEIMDDAITTPKIQDDAITTPKIQDDAITTPKIEDGAVTTPKIQLKAIFGEHLNYDSIYFLGEIKYAIGIFPGGIAVGNWLLLTHTETDIYNQNKEIYSSSKWPKFAQEQPQFVFDGYFKFNIFLNKFHFVASPESNVSEYVDIFKNFNSPYYDYLKNSPNIHGGTVGSFDGIKIEEKNMPYHNHDVANNTFSGGKRVNSIGVQRPGLGAEDFAVASMAVSDTVKNNYFNLITNYKGGNAPLQWLPPAQMVFAYIYMGYPAY